MSKSKATAADVKKYADYNVVIKESERPCSIGEADGGPIRIYLTAYRVPSRKLFEVFIRSNATPNERQDGVMWASRLPSGSWAEVDPFKWFRCKRAGAVAFWQSIGRRVADPLLELEVEEFKDGDVDFELSALIGARA